jgi:hypothetical protein
MEKIAVACNVCQKEQATCVKWLNRLAVVPYCEKCRDVEKAKGIKTSFFRLDNVSVLENSPVQWMFALTYDTKQKVLSTFRTIKVKHLVKKLDNGLWVLPKF